MKIARILLVALLAAPLCRADDSADLSNKLVTLLVSPDMMHEAFEAGLKPSLDQMRSNGAPADLVESIHDVAKSFFAENFKWDEVKPLIAKVYSDNFTPSELSDMISFYQSPTGQKLASKQTTLMQQSMSMAMGRVQKNMPDFQRRVGVLIQDYQKSHAPQQQAAPAAGSPTVTVPKEPSN